jgi:hypothetical protein
MKCSTPSVSTRADNTRNVLTLSPLLVLLECDVVALLNMLVTLARSLSMLLVGLPLPLSFVTCAGVFGLRSTGDIDSGSSVNGLVRMFDDSESPLALGRGRSDVFVGF